MAFSSHTVNGWLLYTGLTGNVNLRIFGQIPRGYGLMLLLKRASTARPSGRNDLVPEATVRQELTPCLIEEFRPSQSQWQTVVSIAHDGAQCVTVASSYLLHRQ